MTFLVILGIILISGFTYAFFTASTNKENVSGNTGKLDISYNISENITGTFIPSASREDGLKSKATAKINSGSLPAAFNIYITPTIIDGLTIEALKWEVEGISNNSVVYTNSGNFSKASAGTPIKIVDGYALKSVDTVFNIYIWIDGNMIASAISNKRFSAKVTADSVPITGQF